MLPHDARHPVVFFINGIGDGILNLPALRALSEIFPDRLTLLCSSGSYTCVFDELSLLRRVPIDAQWVDCGREFDYRHVARQVDSCDLFVSLVPWQSRSLKGLMKLLGPELTIGLFPGFDIEVPLDYGKHTSELAFDIVTRVSDQRHLGEFLAPVIYPEEAMREAREILRMFDQGTRVLTVHADTQERKMWPAGRFAAVLNHFLEDRPEFVALLVGHTAQPIDLGPHRDRIIPCYGLRLPTSLSLVSQSDLFLGVDSCMLHVADFSRVPAVGLFGPTRAEEFGVYVGPHVTIQAVSEVAEIAPRHVFSALKELLLHPATAALWHLSGGAVETPFQSSPGRRAAGGAPA